MSQRTHDAFVGGNPHRAAPTAPTRSYFNRPSIPNHGASANPPPHAPPPPQRFDNARARPPMTTPDSRHQPKTDATCELCGTPGHTGKTCYVRRRVRAMATDDRQDWFMNFLAEVDASDPEDPSTTPSVGPSEIDDEVTVASGSDFASRCKGTYPSNPPGSSSVLPSVLPSVHPPCFYIYISLSFYYHFMFISSFILRVHPPCHPPVLTLRTDLHLCLPSGLYSIIVRYLFILFPEPSTACPRVGTVYIFSF